MQPLTIPPAFADVEPAARSLGGRFRPHGPRGQRSTGAPGARGFTCSILTSVLSGKESTPQGNTRPPLGTSEVYCGDNVLDGTLGTQVNNIATFSSGYQEVCMLHF